MEMPKYSGLLRVLAQLGAVIGCIMGTIGLVGGLAAGFKLGLAAGFKLGWAFGFASASGGLYLILGSLAGLGVTYCFLAMVQAQIETRNALISYIKSKKIQNPRVEKPID